MEKIKYVYIMSQEHSGSTLLTFLLNIHDQICSVAEPCVLGEKIPVRWERKIGECSCGESYSSCLFWNKLLAGLAARGYGLKSPDFFKQEMFKNRFLEWLHLKSFTSRRLAFLNEIIAALFRKNKLRRDLFIKSLVEIMFDITGANVYLDASKSPNYALNLARNPHLEFFVINLTRDGRGVINSWKRLKKFAGYNFNQLFEVWSKIETRRFYISAKMPRSKIYQLSYEELCQAPEKRLNNILNFIGLENVKLIDFKKDVEHHFFGNRMRRDNVVEIRVDEKWKKALSKDELELFKTLGGNKINRLNGYEN